MTDDTEAKPDNTVVDNTLVETASKKAVGEKASANSEPKSKTKPQDGGRSFAWLNGFLLLVIITALGASGYGHWWHYQQTRQQQQTLTQLSESLEQQVAQQRQQLQQTRDNQTQLQQQLRQQIQAAENTLQEQRDAQNILAQQLEAQNQRLLQLSSTNSANWELAEALYLTRLANQRLVMEQNREAALALLQGADEILARQQNPQLFPIREALNQDITALKGVETVDREGLFLQLSALQEQLQHLSLTQSLNFSTRNEADLPKPVPEEDKNWWQKLTGSFQSAIGRLDDYVRKIELEGPVKPLLAPDEQQNIRLAITLYLESAQIALLRGQAVVFKNALQQAEQQLLAYYPETSQRQELVLALQSLRAEAVDPELPDISQSYLRLNDFIQSHDQQAGSEPSSNGAQQ